MRGRAFAAAGHWTEGRNLLTGRRVQAPTAWVLTSPEAGGIEDLFPVRRVGKDLVLHLVGSVSLWE